MLVILTLRAQENKSVAFQPRDTHILPLE